MEQNLTSEDLIAAGGQKSRRTRLILAAIIAVGFALRFTVMIHGIIPPDKPFRVASDALDYYQLASCLAIRDEILKDRSAGAIFGKPCITDDASWYVEPEIFRTPGYPVFEAAIMKLPPKGWDKKFYFGPPESGIPQLLKEWREIFPILFVQVVLDCLLMGLTFWLGSILVSRETGLLAAGFQAVSPLAIGACCMPLSDSLFALIFTAGLIMLAKFLKNGSWLMLILSANLMAVGCYVRPVGIVLSAIIAIAIFFVRSRRRDEKNLSCGPAAPGWAEGSTPEGGCATPRHHNKSDFAIRLARALTFGAIIVACLMPWVIRNIKVADYYGFSSFATDSLFKFSASRIEAEKTDRYWESVNEEMEDEVRRVAGDNQGDMARLRAAKAWQVVWENPGKAIALHLKGDVAFFLPGGTDVLQLLGMTRPHRGTLDVIRTEGLIAGAKNYFDGSYAAMLAAVPMLLFFLVQVAGVIWLAVKKLRLSMPAFAWIVLLLAAAGALLPGPCNHPRFRVPFEPVINIAAAAGFFIMLARRKRQTV